MMTDRISVGHYSGDYAEEMAKNAIRQLASGTGYLTHFDTTRALVWAMLKLLELHPEVMS